MDKTAAVTTPTIDLWFGGLLSIFTISIVLILGPQFFVSPRLGTLIAISTLINGAHFMASYRMLYFSRGYALRYKSASIIIPTILFLYSIFAIGALPEARGWVQALLILSSVYLAIHYNGQAWGMVSSYAYVSKLSFSQTERKIFRWALRILICWQVIWALNLVGDQLPTLVYAWLPTARAWSQSLLVLAFIGGLIGFSLFAQRNKITPPLRIISPFFALFFWYLMLNSYPGALVLVQFFHAIQYLGFPTRVEANRTARAEGEVTYAHLIGYGLALALVSALIFFALPYLIKSQGSGFEVYAQVILACINIHHFYIDGVIWKISSPAVRDDLFAHLQGSKA